MVKSFGYWFIEFDWKWYSKEYKSGRISKDEYFDIMHNNRLEYDHTKKRWVTEKEYTGSVFPSGIKCNSLKAAKRHMKKHNEIPKGTHMVLVSRYTDIPNIRLVK